MQTSEFPGLTTMTSKRHRYDHIWITTSLEVSKYGPGMPKCMRVTWLIYIGWGTICIGRGTVTSVEGKKSGYGLRRWVAGLEFIKVYALTSNNQTTVFIQFTNPDLVGIDTLVTLLGQILFELLSILDTWQYAHFSKYAWMSGNTAPWCIKYQNILFYILRDSCLVSRSWKTCLLKNVTFGLMRIIKALLFCKIYLSSKPPICNNGIFH